jgi:hypothetical protein
MVDVSMARAQKKEVDYAVGGVLVATLALLAILGVRARRDLDHLARQRAAIWSSSYNSAHFSIGRAAKPAEIAA